MPSARRAIRGQKNRPFSGLFPIVLITALKRGIPVNRRRLIAGSAAICATSTLGGMALSKTASGLIVPPEEDRHERTFMQWPVNRKVHPEKAFLDILQKTIADIANTIVEFEHVTILVAKEDQKRAKTLISNKIEIWNIPTEDLWCRDSGPLFAK